MHYFSWEKGFFSSRYRLLNAAKEQHGQFHQPTFEPYSLGSWDDTDLKFKKKGFFSSESDIIDLKKEKVIGTIRFNGWGNKAKISLDQKKYSWKYDNFWGTKWSISENEDVLFRYESSFSNGEIESVSDDKVLLLSGIYVHNYYLAIMIVIAVSTALIASR